MIIKQLREIIAGLPDNYEVRPDVRTKFHTFYVDVDMTIHNYEICHDCKCLFLGCGDKEEFDEPTN